jgi:DNA-directed RNA polymerase subunit RPC12/RpoP
MFITDCQACGLRELRGARSIELLVNTGHGVDAVYRCARCATTNLVGTSRSAAPAGDLVAA